MSDQQISKNSAPFTLSEPKTQSIRWLLLGLVIAYVLAGVFGHDPWKADEPYSFGMVLNFLQGIPWSVDWVVPHVGADAFVEKPPLMYWTGALLAHLTSAFLPLHEGAQLAVIAWMAVTLITLATTSRWIYGSRYSLAACILLLGTIGVIVHVHKLIADVPQLAGATLALAGLVRFVIAPQAPTWKSGLLLGTGAGIAFLSKGILVPGLLALTYLVSVIFLPVFRTRRAAIFLLSAVLAALPWLLIWPYLFWDASQPLFIEWFWDNNFGRFFGFSDISEPRTHYWKDIGLAVAHAFPAGWLAVAELFKRWRARPIATNAQGTVGSSEIQSKVKSARALLWIYVITFYTALLMMSSMWREVYLLPVYPALALLAASTTLPARLDRIWGKAAVFFFSACGLWFWFCWGLLLTGNGRSIPALFGRWLPLDYVLSFNLGWLLAGLSITGLWICVIAWRARVGAIVISFAGITLIWGLMHTVLLPWINEARSYRSAFTALKVALPKQYDCLAAINMGESERAMLHYFVGVRPVQSKAANAISCQAALILDKADHHLPALPPATWQEIWHGGRMGDDNERFRAYLRRELGTS